MTVLNEFELEFFNITLDVRQPLTHISKNTIYKQLLKLNNPTYYSKHIVKNPIERHGYTSTRVTNPILLAIKNMLAKIKNTESLVDLQKQLQVELSWVYYTILGYKAVDI